MDKEFKLWMVFWAALATVLCTLILSLSFLRAKEIKYIGEAMDPISAACALNDSSYQRDTCVAYMVRR